MDTANYLKNQLVTQRNNEDIIPEERWTDKKQDVSHLRIWGATPSTHIPKEKRQNSYVKKTWKGIFIGYTDTTKHYRPQRASRS